MLLLLLLHVGLLQQHLQPLIVAAACEAAAALAAAPAALLPPTAGQQAGLPAVLSSCKALLLACKVRNKSTVMAVPPGKPDYVKLYKPGIMYN
jgi:hypothetical protein